MLDTVAVECWQLAVGSWQLVGAVPRVPALLFDSWRLAGKRLAVENSVLVSGSPLFGKYDLSY
ncbi:MAG: hypothetical protein WBA89_13300 [Microcoleus sp.]|uniref:hypothetical protein n=1 Tax=Microcoleus sp. TaxID=44472 RepID=UPI003C75E18F